MWSRGCRVRRGYVRNGDSMANYGGLMLVGGLEHFLFFHSGGVGELNHQAVTRNVWIPFAFGKPLADSECDDSCDGVGDVTLW